jgi:hypothetical protein
MLKLLRYFNLFSTLAFTFAVLYLAVATPQWDPYRLTISRLALFGNNEFWLGLFMAGKSILDLFWIIYIIRGSKVSLTGVEKVFLFIPVLAFALTGLISVNTNLTAHRIFAYLAVTSWTTCEILLARAVRQKGFFKFTLIIVWLQIFLVIVLALLISSYTAYTEIAYFMTPHYLGYLVQPEFLIAQSPYRATILRNQYCFMSGSIK